MTHVSYVYDTKSLLIFKIIKYLILFKKNKYSIVVQTKHTYHLNGHSIHKLPYTIHDPYILFPFFYLYYV